MKIENYFKGFQEISSYRKSEKSKTVLALLKIVSYFTVLIPLGFLAVYGISSIRGRFTKKQNLSTSEEKIQNKANKVLSKNEGPVSNNSVQLAQGNMKFAQPEIVSDDWGKITLNINGSIQKFKDVVILPSEDDQVAEAWNWAWDKEAMHHSPGIRLKDVDHFILSRTPKPDVVILSQGRGHGGKRDNPGPGILEMEPGLREYIESRGIGKVYILKTAAAIEKYNEIRNQGNKRIAALIHTTC